MEDTYEWFASYLHGVDALQLRLQHRLPTSYGGRFDAISTATTRPMYHARTHAKPLERIHPDQKRRPTHLVAPILRLLLVLVLLGVVVVEEEACVCTEWIGVAVRRALREWRGRHRHKARTVLPPAADLRQKREEVGLAVHA